MPANSTKTASHVRNLPLRNAASLRLSRARWKRSFATFLPRLDREAVPYLSHSRTPTTEASCGRGIRRTFWKQNGGKSGSADSGRASPFFSGFLGQTTLICARLRIRRMRLNSTMNERWLSVAEIAAHLGVNPDTIYKWIERKQLPAHKVGRLWKFMASEVDEWVRAGKAAEPNRET